jgi:RNA polymerase sigma factor (sigma-70 family)
MGDAEIVASIVAGDPEGLAEAYDRYASDLYGYCRSLLREPDDAADAVQDTFVIAASKLSGLREPARLRAWLFAVARNECLHRLKSRRTAAPLQDAPEPADDTVDIGAAAERAETIALVRAAVNGLNDGERDVINQLWHGLEVPEVAAVLGVSRNHAHALFSRAREQLEASVGVLLVGRAGRGDCAELDSLLGDWDGRLTARLRRRVGRHIDQCRVCSDRRRQELTPALLYGITPGALIAMSVLRGVPALNGIGHAAGQLAVVRDTVLRLVADSTPQAAAVRAAAGQGTHLFGANGFPKAPHTGYLSFLPRGHLPLAAVGGTAVAATATATIVATAIAPPPRPAPALHGSRPSVSAPLPGITPLAGAAAPPAAGPHRTALGGPAGSAAATGAATIPGVQAVGPAPVPTTGGAAGTTTTTDPGEGLLTTSPTTEVSATTPAATVTVTTGGSSSAATLSVSPTTVLLSPLLGGSLTLTASGGPVSWSVSTPATLLGNVTVSPSSGTLDAGDSVTLTITVTGLLSLDSQLTVDPGGHLVTIVLGLA